MKKIILLSLVVLMFFAGCGTKQLENGTEIMKKVQDKYDNATSIQVNFVNDALYQNSRIRFKGINIIKTPDKYYSKVNVQSDSPTKLDFTVTSISNGKSLWKITEQNKEAPRYSMAPVTPELLATKVNYMIFDEIDIKNQNYQLSKTQKENGRLYYVMELKEGTIKTYIWVNANQWTIEKAEIYSTEKGASKEPVYRCVYSNYLFNKNIPDSKFKYVPTKNAIREEQAKS